MSMKEEVLNESLGGNNHFNWNRWLFDKPYDLLRNFVPE
jgi:hypothetical protein